MSSSKLNFITTELTPLFSTLSGTDTGKWGKMNAQQTVEHVADFFKVSSRKLIFPVVTPVEYLPRFKEFLLSDKEFRENTVGPKEIVPEEPAPMRNETYSAAITELQNEIDGFVDYFKVNEGAKTDHPVFGNLDFNEWVLLHYKHVVHHAKQFGLL